MSDSSADLPPIPSSGFVLLSRGKWDPDISPERLQAVIDDFYIWLERMTEAGKMLPGSRLGNDCRIVRRNSLITDGPFGEAKEVIGGYWYILTDSIDEAAALAATSPCLDCGLYYEIRPLDPNRARATAVTSETPLPPATGGR